MNKHQIDVEELKRLKAIGYSRQALADHFGCSVATIGRRLKPWYVAMNRECNRRWHQIGPILREYPKRCKWCGVDYIAGQSTGLTCSDYCKLQFDKYRHFFVELSPRQLAEHVAELGLTEDSAARLGMTLDELREAINGRNSKKTS